MQLILNVVCFVVAGQSGASIDTLLCHCAVDIPNVLFLLHFARLSPYQFA